MFSGYDGELFDLHRNDLREIDVHKLLATACLILTFSASALQADKIFTIAGTGKAVYSGDGGEAVKAGVGGPFGISLGPDRAVYVCEISNHVVRRIDEKTGTISTVAGSGKQGYAGDGGPATNASLSVAAGLAVDEVGNLYIADTENLIHEHAERSGFPANKVTAVRKMIDPVTAEAED